jgi:signal transduction histidine kinase
MLKARIILFIIFLLLNLSSGISQQTNENKNILILLSFSPSTPAYKFFIDEIRQKLSQEFGDSYTLYMEYLETEKYPEGKYPKERFDLYNERYRKVKLDLLICIGVNVIIPIKQNADSYLLNLPTISLDYDFSEFGYRGDFTLNNRTAVIALKLDFAATLSNALSLFPKTSSIYFISGVARFDNQLSAISEQAAEKIKGNRNITFIKDTSMDDIIKLVHSLPENSLVFVTSFIMDKKLVPYYNPDAIRIISRESNAPVFHYNNLGVGNGSVGGYILSFNKVGQQIGESAIKILKGTNPNSIKVTEKDYYEYLFDWRELKRFNLINSELIPKESTILFEEITFWGKYKWILGVALLLLILLSALIANLIRLNRKQKAVTKQVKETETMYRDLLHEDRSLRLGQLTASLSHELNQPLTAILYSAQAGMRFLKSGALDSKQTEEILGNIIEDNKRAAGIISSIRSMMKIETREMETENLNSLIGETINIFHAEALHQHIQIKRGLQDDPVYVLGDKIQLQQIILNFMSNATAAMQKNDSENKILGISQLVENGSVTVSVRDSGPGIDATIKDKLFKPFVTSRKSGLGIGLAISKSIIEKHKGEIWANNIKDGGAEFSFKLKVIKDE